MISFILTPEGLADNGTNKHTFLLRSHAHRYEQYISHQAGRHPCL